MLAADVYPRGRLRCRPSLFLRCTEYGESPWLVLLFSFISSSFDFDYYMPIDCILYA